MFAAIVTLHLATVINSFGLAISQLAVTLSISLALISDVQSYALKHLFIEFDLETACLYGGQDLFVNFVVEMCVFDVLDPEEEEDVGPEE